MTNRLPRNRIRHNTSDRIYYGISGFFMTLLLILVSYPMIYVVSASISSGAAVSSGRVVLWPVEINLAGYRAVFKNKEILGAYWNTIVYTSLGTIINVTMALITAYPLSRRDLKGRNAIMLMFTFTMLFSGGLVPAYMNISNLRMIDTLWVMIIPGALSVYNMIITRTFIQSSIPTELLEAASIDGCSDAAYFTKIVLPLSKAVIAVVALFSAVGHWNSYFTAMIYLNSRAKLPVQNIMRELLVLSQINISDTLDPESAIAMMDTIAVLKYALIVVATAPILCIYPFVQKYFVKGVMIGSVKG